MNIKTTISLDSIRKFYRNDRKFTTVITRGATAELLFDLNKFSYLLDYEDPFKYIDQITFLNDIVETEKGICIGDSSSDVIAKYGEPTTKTDSKLEYANGSLYLKFSLENGDVKSINFIRVLTENK